MQAGQGLNFSKLLYRPVFDRLGVHAQLNLASGTFNIIALDKTIGVALPQAGGTVLETLTPIAELMVSDVLALGIGLSDFDDQTITLNGKTWHIISHRLNPSNSGITDGTIYLQLEGDADD